MKRSDVGLMGFAGSGKDTAAMGLVANGWLREAFADSLKILATDFGWDGTKDGKGRKLLQDLGMAARAYDPDFWVDQVRLRLCRGFLYYEKMPRVYTDVRFANEAEFVRKRGGILIRINRPEINEGKHESELNQFGIRADYEVDNTGTIQELKDKILKIVQDHDQI